MASASLPAWLDINPTQNLIQSAQIGGELGARSRQMDISQQRGDEANQFQQEKVAMLSDKLQEETQRAAAMDQEAKMKMNLQWQEASKKYQAQQQYQQMFQNLISQGIDPNTAAIQATMAVGVSGGGTAGMLRAAEMGNGMAQVPAGVSARGGGAARAAVPDSQKEMDAFDKEQFNSDIKRLDAIQKETETLSQFPNPNKARALLNERDLIQKDMATLRSKYQDPTAVAGAASASPFQDLSRPVGNFSPNPDFQARPTAPGAGGGGASAQDPLGLGIGGKGTTTAAPPGGATAPTAAPAAQIPDTGIESIDKAAKVESQQADAQQKAQAETQRQQKISQVKQQIDSTQKEIEAIVNRQKVEEMIQSEQESYYDKEARAGRLSSVQTGGTATERKLRVKFAQDKLAQLNQMLSKLQQVNE